MKKVFLTAVLAFATMFASAQIMVVTTYDGDQEESIDKLTANMGIGYSINDNIVIGGVKNGDDYDLFARYNFKDDLYFVSPGQIYMYNLKPHLDYCFVKPIKNQNNLIKA